MQSESDWEAETMKSSGCKQRAGKMKKIRFRCDWRRRLFATSYAVVSEMVVTDIKPSADAIPVREAFGTEQALSDDATLFFDKDFWGNYNIIKPEESLEKAVGKLKKMQGAESEGK